MADLGIDISSYPDYDLLGTLVSGNVALSQRIARRLTNPRGAWSWAPNECYDIRSFLNAQMTSEKLAEIKNGIERECLREEAVNTITATLSWSSADQRLTASLSGSTSTGAFSFVLGVTSVTLTLLQAG